MGATSVKRGRYGAQLAYARYAVLRSDISDDEQARIAFCSDYAVSENCFPLYSNGTLPTMRSTDGLDELTTVLDGIKDAAVKVDRQANCLAMNRAAVEIFRELKRDPAQLIGQS